MNYQIIFWSKSELQKSWTVELKLIDSKIFYKSCMIINSNKSSNEIKKEFLENDNVIEVVDIILLED